MELPFSTTDFGLRQLSKASRFSSLLATREPLAVIQREIQKVQRFLLNRNAGSTICAAVPSPPVLEVLNLTIALTQRFTGPARTLTLSSAHSAISPKARGTSLHLVTTSLISCT